jgi:hypothetical protein
MDIMHIETKKGRKYIVLVDPVDGLKLWKQPEKADFDPIRKIAYARSIEWGLVVRKWAQENGYGKIKVKLDPVKLTNRPRGRPRKHARREKIREEKEVSGDA